MPELYDVVISSSTANLSPVPRHGYTELSVSDLSGNFMSVSVNFAAKNGALFEKHHQCKTEPLRQFSLWVENNNSVEIRQERTCALNALMDPKSPHNLTVKAYYGLMHLGTFAGNQVIVGFTTGIDTTVAPDRLQYVVAGVPHLLPIPKSCEENQLEPTPELFDTAIGPPVEFSEIAPLPVVEPTPKEAVALENVVVIDPFQAEAVASDEDALAIVAAMEEEVKEQEKALLDKMEKEEAFLKEMLSIPPRTVTPPAVNEVIEEGNNEPIFFAPKPVDKPPSPPITLLERTIEPMPAPTQVPAEPYAERVERLVQEIPPAKKITVAHADQVVRAPKKSKVCTLF